MPPVGVFVGDTACCGDWGRFRGLHTTCSGSGAGDGIRTRDLLHGKQTLYQLSYSRSFAVGLVVGERRLELLRLTAPDPKSGVSTDFTTRPLGRLHYYYTARLHRCQGGFRCNRASAPNGNLPYPSACAKPSAISISRRSSGDSCTPDALTFSSICETLRAPMMTLDTIG